MAESIPKICESDITAWLSNGEYAIDFDESSIAGERSPSRCSACGLSGERDNGNGSLMRIMPLAFADASDDVRAASAITHAHAISMEACSRHGGCFATDSSKAYGRKSWMMNRYAVCRDEVGSSGFVKDTYEAALCASRIPMIIRVVCSPLSTWVTIQTRPPPSPDTGPASAMDSMPFPQCWRCARRELIEDVPDGRSLAWH